MIVLEGFHPSKTPYRHIWRLRPSLTLLKRSFKGASPLSPSPPPSLIKGRGTGG